MSNLAWQRQTLVYLSRQRLSIIIERRGHKRTFQKSHQDKSATSLKSKARPHSHIAFGGIDKLHAIPHTDTTHLPRILCGSKACHYGHDTLTYHRNQIKRLPEGLFVDFVVYVSHSHHSTRSGPFSLCEGEREGTVTERP